MTKKTHQILCDHQLPRSLDVLCRDIHFQNINDALVELWVFEDLDAREKAESLLRAQGILARVRSAYKPLVHWILEEADMRDVTDIIVHYPVATDCSSDRFLLECYPVTELVAGCPLRFAAKEPETGKGPLSYSVKISRRDGSSDSHIVIAPNKTSCNFVAQTSLSNCGWMQITAPDSTVIQSAAVETDLEATYRLVGETLVRHKWPAERPCFERLIIRIEAPFWDRPLPLANQLMSTSEAMHEDIYFSALEFFNTLDGNETTGRTTFSGQVVPDIITSEKIRVSVELADFADMQVEDDTALTGANPADLSQATHWLSPTRIKAALDALNGSDYQAASRTGLPIWGTQISGPEPQILLSSGQHPNETSAMVGALRAAEVLAREGGIGFAVSPLENPDGYALFRSLVKTAPQHMHHAARYTASGVDLEYSADVPEVRIRHIGRELTAANLHINLHGYPAHEWTRPFSGYIPRGFEKWTIPFGFFLVLRYWPGWEPLAKSVLRRVTADLASYAPLMERNRQQYEQHGKYIAAPEFEMVDDIPVFSSETNAGLMPVTLITEASDETIYGQDFIIAHTAQMRCVLAAVRAFSENQHLLPEVALTPRS